MGVMGPVNPLSTLLGLEFRAEFEELDAGGDAFPQIFFVLGLFAWVLATPLLGGNATAPPTLKFTGGSVRRRGAPAAGAGGAAAPGLADLPAGTQSAGVSTWADGPRRS